MIAKKLLMASGVLMLTSVAGAPALAQSTNTIEELVVTAEKRDQSLQDVPVAISAFNSLTLSPALSAAFLRHRGETGATKPLTQGRAVVAAVTRGML